MEALQRLHNRGSISTGYDIDNSLKFEEDNLEAVYAQPTADGNQRTWTVSMWFKRTEITTSGHYHTLVTALVGAETGSVYITPTDELICDVGLGGTRNRQQTAMKFRDTSAWYHIVWRVDTTQGTAADRHRLYVNGVLQEWTTIDGYPAQNFQSNWNNNYPIYIGCYSTYNNYGMCGYIAEVHHTDGISHAPTEFGEFDEDTGIWKPKEYTGSYGAQGFYLPFDNSSNLGTNAKGNDVNFTLQNIAAADQATDTPTNNFATFNIIKRYNQGTMSFQNGGTEVTVGSGGGFWTTVFTSMAVNKGKWYFEAEVRVANGTTMWGCTPVGQTEININTDWYLGQNSNGQSGAGFYDNDDAYYHAGGATACTISGSSFNTQAGDIVMIGVDMDNNKLYAGVNGNWCNSSDNTLPNATGITIVDELTYFAMAVFNAATHKANFGGYTTISISSAASDDNGYGTFEYAPPSGYYALCTKNLEEYG